MYTPTNWQTGDTITAEKMNNIEQGISSIKNATVKLQGDGTDYSLFLYYAFIKKGTDTENEWSIESNLEASVINLTGYSKVFVMNLPLDDVYATALLVDDYTFRNNDITVTGDIDSDYVIGRERVDADTWASVGYGCYIVRGNGTLTVTPK